MKKVEPEVICSTCGPHTFQVGLTTKCAPHPVRQVVIAKPVFEIYLIQPIFTKNNKKQTTKTPRRDQWTDGSYKFRVLFVSKRKGVLTGKSLLLLILFLTATEQKPTKMKKSGYRPFCIRNLDGFDWAVLIFFGRLIQKLTVQMTAGRLAT